LTANALEGVLKRDRLVVLASLVAIALIAWLYLFQLAADMAAMDAAPAPAADSMNETPGMDMPGMDMPGMKMEGPHSASDAETSDSVIATFAFLAAMWMVMMVGMMLPSAASTILLFAALERKRQLAGPLGRTALFVSGYFLTWFAFSVVAAGAQTALQNAGLMSMDMSVTNSIAGGVVFILAGLYEFSPLKNRCLSHCRSPLEWIAHHQRQGPLGALQMGMSHGLYCVGCCWMLMLLLFIGGVMNLLWVAAIAGVVLVEKLLPGGPIAARIAGGVLLASGAFLIFKATLAA
jgi:predicted metal-binding membrane protein